MIKQERAPSQIQTAGIDSLYKRYAAMLLGYIQEVVKDREQAEDYLVKIFSDIAKRFSDIDWDEHNAWCTLQRLAKTELTNFKHAVEDCAVPDNSSNKYLDQMTGEQRQVFCSVYYNKKTTAQLSIELNKSEDIIRKVLKEAFAIIRKQHGN